jgi:myo-inositol-1(or 4)-monophosphatase
VSSPDPRFLSTAIEAVVRAGDIQIARFGKNVHVRKKSAIDLVTDVDLEVERMFRALIAERFPDHDVLAEEMDVASRGASHRWVFDPLDGTTNFAHGVPIFCASLALEIDGEAAVAAVYDPNRRELFTAEAGGGSRLNGVRLKVSATATVLESMLVTGFPYNIHEKADEFLKVFGRVLKQARAIRRLGSAAIDICWRQVSSAESACSG